MVARLGQVPRCPLGLTGGYLLDATAKLVALSVRASNHQFDKEKKDVSSNF